MAQGDLNDKFRAVHDYFGHAVNKNQFGPKGEEAAAIDHLVTLTPDARPALVTETRGQNSFVNFGPHMRNEAGELIQKGEPGYLPLAQRPFAQQKAGLLPDEFTDLIAKVLQKDPSRLQLLASDETGAVKLPGKAAQAGEPTQAGLPLGRIG